MTERIHKVIAASGYGSRRDAERWIRQGRVTVDGEEAVIGQRIDPHTSRVEIDEIVLPVAPGIEHHLVNKPPGVVSTVKDTHGRPIVTDLVGSEARLWPVGRLDQDSEGLIILTNDGTLTHRLTHPRFEVTKTYVAMVDGDISDASIKLLVDGVELDDGIARARSAKIVDRSPGRCLVELVMTEGRNREVRRMCDAVGHRVERLVRTAIAGLRDQRLKPGTSRTLTMDEVRALYEASGGTWQDDDPAPGDDPAVADDRTIEDPE